MLRRPQLDQLARYAPYDEDARAMNARQRRFVEQEPRCIKRALPVGHHPGSDWINDNAKAPVQLTQHRKLDRWLQLGGHADGEDDVLSVALREAREESGLAEVSPILAGIFVSDVHVIPARGDEPQHFLYDARWLLVADRSLPRVISSESKVLAWVSRDELPRLSSDRSMLRMAKKLKASLAQGSLFR